jgi:hypothetical protein
MHSHHQSWYYNSSVDRMTCREMCVENMHQYHTLGHDSSSVCQTLRGQLCAILPGKNI